MKQDRINVLHAVHKLTTGGAERVLVNLINYSSPDFFHHVVSFFPSDDFGETITSNHCKIWELGKKIGNDVSAPRKLRKIIKETGAGLVHAQGWGVYAEGLIAAKFLGRPLPFVYAFRGKTWEDMNGTPWRRRIFQQYFALFCTGIITPSKLMKTDYAADIGISEEKIKVIYNGVDTGLFRPSEHPQKQVLTIGCVARLDPVKGVDLLVEAFSSLIQRGYDLKLVVIGDGPARCDLEKQICELGLIDRVKLPGWRRDIPEFLRSVDLYVQPSRYEGVSNSILEALATGLPVVATAVGGTPEIFCGPDIGTLVKPTVQDIVAGVEKIMIDPTLRNDHGRNGRRKIMGIFSLDRMVRGYEELFRQVVVRGR